MRDGSLTEESIYHQHEIKSQRFTKRGIIRYVDGQVGVSADTAINSPKT